METNVTLPSRFRPSSLPNILGRVFEIPSVVAKQLTVALPTQTLALACCHADTSSLSARRSLLLFRRSFFFWFLAQVHRLKLYFRFYAGPAFSICDNTFMKPSQSALESLQCPSKEEREEAL